MCCLLLSLLLLLLFYCSTAVRRAAVNNLHCFYTGVRMPMFLMSKAHTLLIAMCLHTQAASKKESVGRVCPLHHLVGTVSYVSLSQPAPLSMRAYTCGDDVCFVSYGSVHLSVCCVCHVCVCTRVTSSSGDTSGASNHFPLEWKIGRSSSPFFPSISCRNPTENLQPVFLNR